MYAWDIIQIKRTKSAQINFHFYAFISVFIIPLQDNQDEYLIHNDSVQFQIETNKTDKLKKHMSPR